MAKESKNLILLWWGLGLALSIGVVAKISLKPRPVRLVHGLGSDCKFEPPNCIETSAGSDSYIDLRRQARIACDKLKSDIFDEAGQVKPDFKYGFHLTGISQGGIIVRLVFRNCPEVKPYIKTLTTVASPNTGLDQYSKPVISESETPKDWDEVIKEMLPEIEQRTKETMTDKRYTLDSLMNYNGRKSDVIAEIESEDNDYSSLEFMLNVYFSKDEVITPHESMAFGTTFDEEKKEFLPFEDSRYYGKLGLGKLYDGQRMWLCRAAGDHLQWTSKEYKDIIEYNLDGTGAGEVENEEQAAKAYADNVLNLYKSRTFEGVICQTNANSKQLQQRVLIID